MFFYIWANNSFSIHLYGLIRPETGEAIAVNSLDPNRNGKTIVVW